jgi:hypothetical protein
MRKQFGHFFFAILGTEPRASLMLGKCSINELYPQAASYKSKHTIWPTNQAHSQVLKEMPNLYTNVHSLSPNPENNLNFSR